MKNVIKKVILVMMVMMLAVMPAQAACSTPNCVKKAAEKAMNESGMDIAFIIKLNKGNSGKGTAYFMYRKNGKVHCDRSGQVIIGKNEHVNKKYHYSFYRNRDAEKKVVDWKVGKVQYRWRYTSYIECAEGACFNLTMHSYIEYKSCGKAWQTCKGTTKNTDGVAACKEFCRYLWSMADPDCPVVFM